MEKISESELFDECQEIYDFNLEALIIHIYTMSKKVNKRVKKSIIAADLKNRKNLKKYRSKFFEVMDSFKSDIEHYKKIQRFDITATHASLQYCYDNIETLKELSINDRERLERELVDIQFYVDKLFQEGFNNESKT